MTEKFFGDMDYQTFYKWVDYLEKKAEKEALEKVGDVAPVKQSAKRNDSWSMYAYGDIIKVVYTKTAPDIKTRDSAFTANESAKRERKPDTPARFSQSVSRSRSRIFELAMCNEFTHFCTFTQDETKRGRFDLSEFRKDLAQLVRNLNRGRTEKIKYLLIPEQHKDGAWHMHGLLKGLTENDLRLFTLDEKLPDRIRKKLAEGVKIYDWTRYRRAFGYFTCTEIENRTACSKYITKYISKDLQKSVREQGAHLFFASQGLQSRDVIVKNSFADCPIKEFDFENDYIKIKQIQLPPRGDEFTF